MFEYCSKCFYNNVDGRSEAGIGCACADRGQAFAFLGVYILTKTTSGSLSALAVAFAGIPCVLLIIFSIIMFNMRKYRSIAPSIHCSPNFSN